MCRSANVAKGIELWLGIGLRLGLGLGLGIRLALGMGLGDGRAKECDQCAQPVTTAIPILCHCP